MSENFEFGQFLAIEPLCCMVEIIGCVPKLSSSLMNNIDWIRDLMNSTKEEIREFASVLYAVVINEVLSEKDFENAINHLVTRTTNKNLEAQHGAIFGIANAMERRIMIKRSNCNDFSNWELFKNCVNTLGNFVILVTQFF